MDDSECDILLAMGRRKLASGKLGHSVAPQDEGLSQEERAVLTAFEQRVSLIAGTAARSGQDGADTRPVFKRATPQTGASTDSSDEDPTADHRACRVPGMPNGLHVDTHNAQKRRYASVILYLNSIPPGCGGETVFPHAKNAAAALLQANVTHTHSASRRGSDAHVAHAARELLSKAQAVCTCTLRGTPDAASADPADAASHAHIASPETQTSIDRLAHVRCLGDAIAVCPSKGLCLLFYTRHADTKGQVLACVLMMRREVCGLCVGGGLERLLLFSWRKNESTHCHARACACACALACVRAPSHFSRACCADYQRSMPCHGTVVPRLPTAMKSGFFRCSTLPSQRLGKTHGIVRAHAKRSLAFPFLLPLFYTEPGRYLTQTRARQKFETVALGRQPCERKEMEEGSRGEDAGERVVRSRRVMNEEEVARHVWAHVVLPSCREIQGVTRLEPPASAVAWHYVDDEKSSSTFSSPHVTAGTTCQTNGI
jgi:hypothetical protein